MNTVMMSGLLAAMLVAASVPATAAGRERHGVDQRQQHQQQRIHQGVRQGDLTRGEARRLQGQAREIRREEHAFRSDGRFGPGERRHVQRDLDRLSGNIYRERHDGERRFGQNGRRPDFDRRMHFGGARIDRVQDRQHERIAHGIRSGELTRHEARRLMAEQRGIRVEERRYRADGVLTRAERTDLYQDLNAAGQHIYNETHDAQTRR